MTLTNEIQEEAVHYPYSVVVRFRGEGNTTRDGNGSGTGRLSGCR